MTPRLLIADDDHSILEALSERFVARGFAVSTARSGREALAKARAPQDVILLDLQLPDGDGVSVLRGLRAEGSLATVIVITAYGTVRRAVEAMAEGAYDFIEKPFDPSLVEQSIRRALERSDLKRENLYLKELRRLPNFIVSDPKMDEVVKTAKKAAASSTTVLLLGESGAGKEILAQQIHAWSGRAQGPFIALNCVALADSLLESELFGHEKGAFTGAVARKPGKIELAHGGTLFLDEIGDVSPSFQAKLLRVLQERSFERVGGTATISVDVRIIAATNKDLAEMVAKKSFRQDLFYRLNVISLTLPPLRERPSDVRALAEHFVKELAAEQKRPPLSLSAEARALISAYRWPGNIRELKNAIERAVVLCEDEELGPGDLPPELISAAPEIPKGGFHDRVEEFRKKLLRDALAACHQNQTRAAELLGLQRTYLARLIRQYGLHAEP